MAVANFEGQEAVGAEGGAGCGDEAAVDFEAVGAGEEGGVGFVGDDFALHGGGVAEGDVGRVGDDGVEAEAGCDLVGEAGEEVALDELDAAGNAVRGGVLAGDGQGFGGGVRGEKAGAGEVGG